jgi:hypothetical protein
MDCFRSSWIKSEDQTILSRRQLQLLQDVVARHNGPVLGPAKPDEGQGATFAKSSKSINRFETIMSHQ